jgi:hypothetical protein
LLVQKENIIADMRILYHDIDKVDEIRYVVDEL